ncbi:MAG: DUF2336 domain-containing protein [Rhodospirillales bacterium]|nr:DUF2336 domain-containing protein [Rhodospirillales bacterium]
MDFVDDGADETPHDKLARLIQEGGLNEEVISDALAMREKDFVAETIAYLIQNSPGKVQGIFDMGAAKPIVALCWHAGLSMRLALALQKEAGRVNPRQILYPKGGTDYPLTEDELNWQLEFLGLK